MSSLKLTMPSEVDAKNPIAGDLYLGQTASMRMTSTLAEEVAQQLMVRFRFFLGEWFLDAAQGVPWFQTILGQKIPLLVVQQLLRSVAQRCPGVTQVQRFTLSYVNQSRTAAVDFAVILTDGVTLKSSDYGPFLVGPAIGVG